MTSIITWYIIGILVSAIGIFSYEYFYLYNKEIEYIPTKEIVEDVLLSFLSWLMVVWLIISVILDIHMGWPSKGYDLNIKKKKGG
jgi:hypothetical protein